jgi:nucleotide-binding universal stress UspA family protein
MAHLLPPLLRCEEHHSLEAQRIMKNILLAIDGSSHAEAAARFLSCLPDNEKLKVTVLTVVQAPLVNGSYATERWTEEAFDQEKAVAVETYGKTEQMFGGANATLEHELRAGSPGETIVQIANERATELVVLGARGRSRVSRMLLGSTSDYVATHAECSVLVVRPTNDRGADRGLRIAIGFEDSSPAKAALKEFSEIVWGDAAEVHVVSILCCLYGFFDEIPLNSRAGPDSDAANQMRAALDDALTRLRDVAPNAKAHLIDHEHIGDGLVQFVKDHQCDLVVVGETPLSSLRRALLGSVSRFVLRHAPCSVWIARNRML